jgi:hypothetical protein
MAALNGWLKANGWQVFVSIVALLLLIGQWQEQARATLRDVEILDRRLEALEEWAQAERPRLDPIFVAREVSIEQNKAILLRLDAIEGELRALRSQRALQRRRRRRAPRARRAR